MSSLLNEPDEPRVIKPGDPRSSEPTTPPLSQKKQRKKDALDLAELIYDIFKDDMSNAKIKEKDKR